MKHTLTSKAAELMRKNGRHRRWRRAFSGMAAVVVFITTYMLILPAITMENKAICGMAEHTHTDACYEMQLVCTQEETPEGADVHVHGPECYEQQQVLTCTKQEGEGHTHTDACYGYVCGQEESAGHTHTDACYTEVTHRELTCTEPESAGHTHGDGCYDEEGNLVCTEAESTGHTHGDSCYTETVTRELTCGQEESAGHTHTDACIGLICGQEEYEGHTHTDACYTTEDVLVCTEPTGHTHGDGCYEKVLVCDVPEHTHTEECYPAAEPEEPQEPELICTLPEHSHEDACYDADGNLICGMEEHTHTEECYAPVEIPEEETPTTAFPEEIPEGYVEYTFDNEAGLTVTAYAPEGAFGQDVQLFAEVLSEDSEEYAQAKENLDKAENAPEYTGMAAMDIRFVDAAAEDPAAAEEIEPDAEMGQVFVKIDAQALIPENVDESTLAVQHHAKVSDGGIFGTGIFEHTDVVVETVADNTEETGDITAVPDETALPETLPALADEPEMAEAATLEEPAAETEETQPVAMNVEAEFAVNSFSTFTITWGNSYRSVTVNYVDINGTPIPGTQTSNAGFDNREWVDLSDYAGNIVNYEFTEYKYGSNFTSSRHMADANDTPQIRYNSGYYYRTDNFSTGTQIFSNNYTRNIYLVYTATGTQESNNLVWTKTWDYSGRATRRFTDTASLYMIDSKTGEEIGDYVTVERNIGGDEVAFSTVVSDLLSAKGYEDTRYAVVDFYLVRDGQRVDFTDSKYGNWYIWPNDSYDAKFGMRALDKKFGSNDQYVENGDQYYIVLRDTQNIGTIGTSVNEAINFNLYNYSNSYSEDFDQDNFPFGGAKWTGPGGGVTQGLVRSSLNQDGYPVLHAGYYGKSMEYLFSDYDGDKTGVVAYSPQNTLLSYNANTGYYTYDSDLNFAKYDKNTNQFVVYDSPNWTTSETDPPRFLPFNEITDATDKADFRFGMTMDFDFIMPKNGEVNGENMVFKFRGDDDVWVYIDDKLVLDLGGVHDKYEGYIDFATGEIYVESVHGNSVNGKENASKTIYIWDLYGYDSYAKWEANWRYDSHKLNFFYLERGEGGSNCKIEFNMPAIPSNSLLVGKELVNGKNTNPDIKEYLEDTLSYTFQVLKVENGKVTNQSFLSPGTTFQIMKDSVLTGETRSVDSEGKFTIKAGERAVFDGAIKADGGQYVVREIMDSDYTGQYEGVGFTVTGAGGTTEEKDASESTTTDFTHYETAFISAENETTTVTFNNRVDISQLSLLKVTKVIAPGSAIDANKQFPIIIKLDGESIAGAKYIITDAQGKTGELQTVGPDGIISIKGGETINITEGILVGTQYEVSERNDDGYYVTYEGMVSWRQDGEPQIDWPNFDGAKTASGSFEHTNSVVHIAVQNADYQFAGMTTLFKHLEGAGDNDQYTFTFEAVEGTYNEVGHTFVPGAAEPWTFTVNTLGDSGSTDFVVGYKTSDFPEGSFNQAGETYRYYKVREIAEDNGIRYDTGYYVVRVEISKNVATALGMGVTGVHVYRFTADGTYIPDESSTRGISQPMYFTNSVVGDLSITKIVTRTDGAMASGEDFRFEIVLKEGETPKSGGPYAYTITKDGETVEEGTLTFGADGMIASVTVDGNTAGQKYIELDHGETILIKGLPAAAQATITETTTDGYAVSWSGNTATTNDSKTASITTTKIFNNPAVTCTNTTGAVLPSTGGMGTTPFLALGTLLTLGAGMLLVQRRRKEGSDAV